VVDVTYDNPPSTGGSRIDGPSGTYAAVFKAFGKQKASSFFPDSWSYARVRQCALAAYRNSSRPIGQNSTRQWTGVGCGLTIQGYINASNEITTAYPPLGLPNEKLTYTKPGRSPQGGDGGGGDLGGGGGVGGGDNGGSGDGGGSPPPDISVTTRTEYGGQPGRTWVWWDAEPQSAIAFCRVAFSSGQEGFDMGPAGGPQYWNTNGGTMTVTCWGTAGGVVSSTSPVW
jgi:hypothetical protein